MNKIITVLVLAIGIHWRLQAQTVLIIDQTSLQAIENVSIYTSSGPSAMLTSSHGVADISVFKEAATIYFRHPAYHMQTFSFRELQQRNFRVILSEKTYDLDEIVISASKFAEKKSDVPQQIQVLQAKELAFLNQQTTADVIQNSGNVLIQKSQLGGGSPIIRGFEANKVLMVVDGVRMNNAIYRGGHLQNIITMDNSMLDRIEIVFGPGSVVYGSDALGGVMHFFTKNPQLASDSLNTNLKVNAFTRYSTVAHEKTAHADVNLGFRKFAFFTSFTFSDVDDLRQGSRRNPDFADWGKRTFEVKHIDNEDRVIAVKDVNVQKQSGYTQYDFMQKVLFKPDEKTSHTLNFQYSTSSDIPRYDRLTLTSGNGNPRFAQWYYGPQKRLFGSYKVELQADKGLYNSARLIAAYQNIEESRIDRRFGNNTRNHRIENLDILTLNLDLNRNITQHEIRYGLEASYNDVQSSAFAYDLQTGATSPLDTRYPSGGSSMYTLAGYLTHTWEISPAFILTDGLRYNYSGLDAKFADKSFFPFLYDEVKQRAGALNGNLGLVYKPANWRISAVVSSGFRVPNVDDLSKVFESVPGNVIVPNPDLKPERTYNGELGIARQIAGRIQMEAIGFYTLYQDAITTQPSTFNDSGTIVYDGQLSQVTSNQNAQKAYLYGFNANLSADITPFLSLSTTLNYTYGRIRTDSTGYPLDHIPPVFGKTSLTFKTRQFRGEFFSMYNGWKRLKDYNVVGEDNLAYATPEGMPAWYTLNIRMAYQVNRIFQVQAALENILDRNYRVFASGISAPGRNLILTLRATL